jgi:hypothetical protein
MNVKKKQFLLYLEVDRNTKPEKIEGVIRDAFRTKHTPRIRTLLTAINYRNLRSIISQPLVITERELHGELEQEKVD